MMQSSIQCSNLRYCPMTVSRISSNRPSIDASLPMITYTQLQKKAVLKAQGRAHIQSEGCYCGEVSNTNRRHSLERKSRIISPHPRGRYWWQKAEQKPQMANKSCFICPSITFPISPTALFTLSRYPKTAFTVSRNSSQTCPRATGSSVRSAVAKQGKSSWSACEVGSGGESEVSRFCKRMRRVLMESVRSDINQNNYRSCKSATYMYAFQALRGKEGYQHSLQNYSFWNSMQQNALRSLTNSDYAQTVPTRMNATPASPHAYVPFLNKSARFTSRGDSSAPPIGSYDLPSCFDRKKSPFEDRISHFILQAQQKEQQMGIFKSTLTRFQKPPSHSPGPASYNLFSEQPPAPKKPPTKSGKENIQLLKSCPSIPHKGNKYGYVMVNGEMRSIEKTEEQLEKERESRKNYAETLQGENSIFRDSAHRDFHNNDQRKKLFQETTKYLLPRESQPHTRSETHLFRKPRYDHIYHANPAPASSAHPSIGPGHYDLPAHFSTNSRKEKFQFFGSTEVRFKQVGVQQKGYSLLEMIKEGLPDPPKQLKSPIKKALVLASHPEAPIHPVLPGPGQYDPKLQFSKQSHRTAFFPAEQRFKGTPCKEEEEQGQEVIPQFGGRSRSKKSYNANSLKKQRFKPMHRDYPPVRSEQICGILTDSKELVRTGASPKRHMGKLLKLNSKRGTEVGEPEINSWSRQEGRKKGTYMRELKEELAFISYSPVPEEVSKKHTKKFNKQQHAE